MIFEFYWADYEDYSPYIFTGEEKTYEEFKADCNKALKESFDEYLLNANDSWASLSRWMEYAIVKMEDYGYRRIIPMKFGYCGLEIPINDILSTKEYQEDFPEFLDEIEKMIVHNDALDKVLYKYIYDRIDKEEEMDKISTNKIIVEAKEEKKSLNRVLLGGTCGESTWREELIPKLEIDYFNPVVDDWTPECQEEEVKQRENCDYVLYVITSEMQGVYSIAEVVDDSNKRPEKTVFCVIEDGFRVDQKKSLKQVAKMVEENGAKVCKNLKEIASYLNG